MGTRQRSYSWEDPSALAADGLQRPGMEYLRAMMDGELPHPPICATLGFRLTEVDDGWSVFELEPGEHQYNLIDSIHGGVIAAVLDSAAGCAVHSTLPANVGYTTVSLATTFLRTVRSDTGTLRAEGSLVKGGRRIALAEARLIGGDERLHAHATVTCLVMGED